MPIYLLWLTTGQGEGTCGLVDWGEWGVFLPRSNCGPGTSPAFQEVEAQIHTPAGIPPLSHERTTLSSLTHTLAWTAIHICRYRWSQTHALLPVPYHTPSHSPDGQG